MFNAGAGWISRCFGFEFFAAKLSLEKFRNGLNLLHWGRPDNRQKDELLKHSCWPATAPPPSPKLITTARGARKPQSVGF
jgi:hypothetical protein